MNFEHFRKFRTVSSQNHPVSKYTEFVEAMTGKPVLILVA